MGARHVSGDNGWMATLQVDADSITVSLSTLEKVAAMHGDVTIARTSLLRARVVPNGLHEVHGMRAPGTAVPSLLKVGTWRKPGAATFAVCHGRRPAVVLELTGAHFDRLVVTVDDPEGTVAQLV